MDILLRLGFEVWHVLQRFLCLLKDGKMRDWESNAK